MIGTGDRFVSIKWELMLQKGGIALAVWLLFLTTGCSTLNGVFNKSEVDESLKGQADQQEYEDQAARLQTCEDQIAQLQSREDGQVAQLQSCTDQTTQLKSGERELQNKVNSLNTKLRTEKIARESFARRLEITQAAREDAIREVVRMRARIQGMASQAGASAMFAEARVILDRMEEEAFSEQALEDLALARSYMVRGKSALDNRNPGGAAYLFDLIPGLYEGMRKADPRTVRIKVSVAALRKTPDASSPKAGTLYWGDSATGLEKNTDWMKIKASSGKSGWIMRSQVQ